MLIPNRLSPRRNPCVGPMQCVLEAAGPNRFAAGVCSAACRSWSYQRPRQVWYQSYEHEHHPAFSASEDGILSAATRHIPTLGFSVNALAQGARDVGYRDASTNLFPKGSFALVQYHLVTERLALAKNPGEQHGNGDVKSNVKRLAWQRLQANKAIISRWQEVRYHLLVHHATFSEIFRL